MNDLLFKLRQQLISMIEEIDNFKTDSEDTLILKKEDFKSLNYLGKLNSYVHVFEYKNGVKFTLSESTSYPHDLGTYRKLMNGSLELLILNKREKEFLSSGHTINYELENINQTVLRNLYFPPVLDNDDYPETHKV